MHKLGGRYFLCLSISHSLGVPFPKWCWKLATDVIKRYFDRWWGGEEGQNTNTAEPSKKKIIIPRNVF